MTTSALEKQIRDWLRAGRDNPHESAVPPEKRAAARERTRALGRLVRRRRQATSL